ncbi:M4 family metallopeptidase [Thermasporomyces composti]|uniref:M4 family metallopeptidase n=1 Tax=Thermasporomyces composti TaxID=696763 RepID=UPI001FED0173|nr:M4 family metallopeptidase [Thermasporomyces composti]
MGDSVKYRRTVGGLAALATVVSGSALVALATPSYAGSTTGPSFVSDAGGATAGRGPGLVSVLKRDDGSILGIQAKDNPIEAPRGTSSSPKEAAKAHLERFAPRLGVSASDFKPVTTAKVPGGSTVRMQQHIDGLPVVAGEVVVSLDREGRLEALLGETTKGTVEKAKSPLSQAKAATIARRYVAKKAGVSADSLRVRSEGRWIYNPALLGAPGAPVNRETFKFRVSSRNAMVDYTVFVDLGFKSVALAYSNNHAGLNRQVCDLNNTDVGTLDGAACDGTTVPYARQEGDAPTGVDEVDNVYDRLGEVAKWYASYVNLDVSAFIGGQEKSLKATARACVSQSHNGCPMANAFWSDGIGGVVFGDGVSALDVVGHEVTHGVTSHTSSLYYVYQSGALNESISDTMGELIDLAAHPEKRGTDQAWLIGEENTQPGIDKPWRSMKDPTAYDQPDTMTSPLWNDDPELWDNGGVHTNSGVGNKAAYLIAEGDSFNGYDVRGLGLAKTFKIYWTASNLLTSGSDYKDLFHVLPLACRKNIGRPGTHITEDDCAQVDKAVRATEMYKDASKGAPVATPYCEEGETVRASYSQGFDEAPSDWTLAGGAGMVMSDWGVDYVNRGEDALGLFTETGRVDSSTATSEALSIPANSKLRIDYASLMAWSRPQPGASAKLEYNDGSGWKDASALPGSVNGGPWSLHSNGWSSAKYDLSSLAGKQVQFRFTVSGVSGDAQDPVSLLFLDNFKIYTCG